MYLPARFCLLSVLFALASGQRSKPRPQGRTLGLLSPLLFGSAGPLFDAPVAPLGGVSGGGVAAGAGSGTQSDPPNYGFGLGLGYPGLAQSYYGYPGYGLYRPSYNYNYGGYQRPVQYPGNYYGSRPNYGNYNNYNNNYGNRPSSYGSYATAVPPISANPSAGVSPGVGAGSGAGAGAGSQLNTAQAAQLAGLLGQALGSSLRPLLANGGGGAAGAAGGANPQALSGLLGLLG
ncbi:uncharacterized protein Dvir_GJ15067 [Drosophila virilis]|uniref:Uncharacterized protein n=1 Tax=Drosophila virilis TaxID=7244 RepID=B4MFK6_DROVI|nr:uncharacterized protein Dvir_GJ15067 [Drosophila virilis]